MSPLTEPTRLTLAKTSYPDIRNGIVTSDLVLNLDAAQTASYPGTGTTWTDLSGNGNNGTLVNGPTYSSANGGAIVFDGFNDAAQCGNTIPPAGNFSIFAWIYPTSFNNEWNLIATKWFNPDDFHYSLRSNLANGTNLRQNLYTTSNSDIYGTTAFSTNTWYYVGFTLVNGGTLTFYKNAVADGMVSSVSRSPQTSTLRIGDDRGLQYGLVGRIPQVSIYNRALTAAEVQQNFNCLRMRYGL